VTDHPSSHTKYSQIVFISLNYFRFGADTLKWVTMAKIDPTNAMPRPPPVETMIKVNEKPIYAKSNQ
jgi:hypothetical protein